jgi:hypothetical protein
MHQAATAAVPPSFAGMLAALAAPAKISQPDPIIDLLADDVAVFSSAGALESRKSFAAAEEDSPVHQPAPSFRSSPRPAIRSSGLTITEAELPPTKTSLQDRKAASVTIRVSAAECAQLRARAAESGLTVSAYLRSCIFEVEGLRAQVKDALAQLRSAPRQSAQPLSVQPQEDRQTTQAPPKFTPQPAQSWRSRFLPGWKTTRRFETA